MKQTGHIQTGLFHLLDNLLIYPTLTGSKTPTSRFERSKEDKGEITARKDPISLTLLFPVIFIAAVLSLIYVGIASS
ncbi:hypothetical protein [Metabacillus rhizolycopersici]|uniref:Uncharacterized protein n=1 Tax=Metabacillus rhizolycopersici TaxID=2875709 RepID=A0ABS7UZ23_9BACI|nr:hypothetical protein [Metabacillus rhizolycopersici]MBZ5753571.1 hypothetical protein [Metabacillus rhizolycopersici]